MIDFHGKRALVTCGASGIGKALAQALAARGAFVIVADIQDAEAVDPSMARPSPATSPIPPHPRT